MLTFQNSFNWGTCLMFQGVKFNEILADWQLHQVVEGNEHFRYWILSPSWFWYNLNTRPFPIWYAFTRSELVAGVARVTGWHLRTAVPGLVSYGIPHPSRSCWDTTCIFIFHHVFPKAFLDVSHPDVLLNSYKVQFFFSNTPNYIVEGIFKATCLSSIEPSLGILLKNRSELDFLYIWDPKCLQMMVQFLHT